MAKICISELPSFNKINELADEDLMFIKAGIFSDILTSAIRDLQPLLIDRVENGVQETVSETVKKLDLS